MDYHIQIITKDDKLRILKFLRRFFFRDEPLNHSIELIPESEDSTCLELEEYCSMSSLENNLSFMAVSTNGAIIGVILNGKTLIYMYQRLTNVFTIHWAIYAKAVGITIVFTQMYIWVNNTIAYQECSIFSGKQWWVKKFYEYKIVMNRSW